MKPKKIYKVNVALKNGDLSILIIEAWGISWIPYEVQKALGVDIPLDAEIIKIEKNMQTMKPTDTNKDIPSIIADHSNKALRPRGTHPAYTRAAILARIEELHGKASERYAMHIDELEKPENEFIHQLYLDYDEFTYAIKYLIEKLPA